MITGQPFSSKPVVTLPKTNGRVFLYQLVQSVDQRTVIPLHLLIVHYRSGQGYQFTGLTNTQFLLNQEFYRLSFVVRPPYFFVSTVFTASISKVRLATMRFNRAF